MTRHLTATDITRIRDRRRRGERLAVPAHDYDVHVRTINRCVQDLEPAKKLLPLRPVVRTTPREMAKALDTPCSPYPEAFYDEKLWDAAKEVCASCRFRGPCLEEALRSDQRWGVWGGMDPAERRQLTRGVA